MQSVPVPLRVSANNDCSRFLASVVPAGGGMTLVGLVDGLRYGISTVAPVVGARMQGFVGGTGFGQRKALIARRLSPRLRR